MVRCARLFKGYTALSIAPCTVRTSEHRTSGERSRVAACTPLGPCYACWPSCLSSAAQPPTGAKSIMHTQLAIADLCMCLLYGWHAILNITPVYPCSGPGLLCLKLPRMAELTSTVTYVFLLWSPCLYTDVRITCVHPDTSGMVAEVIACICWYQPSEGLKGSRHSLTLDSSCRAGMAATP